MLNRILLACLLSAASTAGASIQVVEQPVAVATVSLSVVAKVGMTSTCGMREAPHLIEHLLLSETEYGETPADAIGALLNHSVRLSAITGSDYTKFTFEGPPASATVIERALLTFLARPSLPRSGFEREKRAIISEVRAPDDYKSTGSVYERYLHEYAGAAPACGADSLALIEYPYPAVNDLFQAAYSEPNLMLITTAPAGTFRLDMLANAITVSRDSEAPSLTSQDRFQGPTNESPLVLYGRPGLVEIIYPVKGLADLSSTSASLLADKVRFAIQAHIRREFGLYHARTFLDQSLKGGWLRIEVPGLENENAQRVLEVAQDVIDNVRPAELEAGWLQPTYAGSSPMLGKPIVIEAPKRNMSLIDQLRESFEKLL